MKLYMIYARPALKPLGLKSFDEFLYINYIGYQHETKKTAVIQANFDELSSGLLIIARLLKKELILETEDAADRRSKRLALTAKGKSILKASYGQLAQLNNLFFCNMPEEDIRLCIQLLSPLEAKFAPLWQKHRHLKFDEIINQVTGA